jgi:hypothetical protein
VTFARPALRAVWQIGLAMIETDFDLFVGSAVDHGRVKVTGHPTFDQLVSMLHLLGVDSVGPGHELLLLDLRDVQTLFTPEQQFRIGQEAALSLAHLRKVASLVAPDRFTRISERAAQRNGTNVRLFAGEAAALAWLRAPG